MNFGVLFVSLVALFTQYQNATGEGVVDVPRDSCEWHGGSYGTESYCYSNQVPVGSCGSGKDADCYLGSSYVYDMIYCCDVEGLFCDQSDDNCSKYYGDYGEDLSCVGLDGGSVNDTVVQGICGSGRDDDCDGYSHMIDCCTCTFKKGLEHLYSTGTCYWQYGNFGSTLLCLANTEAVMGRCGSGGDPDCNDSDNYHGIQCCDLVSLIPID